MTTENDIIMHPELHQHRDFIEVMQCCMVNGAIDLALEAAHERISDRSNGGVRCDVSSGPCSCGAWH